MKPAEKGFPEYLTAAFKPTFNAPQEDVAAACDRVLHRLQSPQVDTLPLPLMERGVDRAKASARWFRPVLALSGATVMALVVLLTFTDSRAVVESGDGGIFIVSNGQALHDGDRIEAGEVVRANGGTGTTLKLPDGSRIEMRSKAELSWERANDGLRIQLSRGSVIVNAAKQRKGHLYVQTKDVTVSVVGTVFLVNAGEEGSSVSVIEGEVRVQQGNLETNLRPGEHVSTAPKSEPRAVKEEIAWSPKVEEHLALLQQEVQLTITPTISPTTGQVTLNAEGLKPRFEEASIRPCTPEQQRGPDLPAGARGGGNLRTIRITPGRFDARCMTVKALIMVAHRPLLKAGTDLFARAEGAGFEMGQTYSFGVDGARGDANDLRGAPDWVFSEGYSIEAITDASTTSLTMQRAMLWDLLERRFQVKVHTEIEQVPAFALGIAPGGLKIRPFQDGDCEKEKKSNFPNPKPRCGFAWQSQLNGPNMRIEVSHAPFAAWTMALGLGAPVIDRTGTTDNFALILEYAPDENSPDFARNCLRHMEKSDRPSCFGRPTAPSIHTALSEIGLKIEPVKAPQEFVVVDRVERPSPN
jgi:uncharacterized protein (TIGR03435 family)